LLFSSGDTAYDEDKLRRAGFSSWLQKPASQSKLLDAMATALACATRAPAPSPEIHDSLFPSPKSEAGLSRVKILLVDDNLIGREVASATLSMLGCEFDVVCDGQEAVDAVARSPYDVILMDCQMPNMDGFEATRLIRRREARGSVEGAAPRIPIVALTANAVKGDRDRCLEAGMDDYLAKPFQADELAATIRRFVPQQGTGQSDDRSPTPQHDLVAPLSSVGIEANETIEPFQHDELMARWGGNQEFVLNLVRMFQNHAPDMVAALEQHVASTDHEQVTQAAHGLKGAAAYVSAETIRRIAGKLEEMGKVPDLRDAAEAVRLLRIELDRCLAFDPSGSTNPPSTAAQAGDYSTTEKVAPTCSSSVGSTELKHG
jgi:CheY-like chemotaxis protein/HPt (histidine-containing phosphotransfer) domain-containing protein